MSTKANETPGKYNYVVILAKVGGLVIQGDIKKKKNLKNCGNRR